MSVDLQSLERKDRAELATIAQALGGKTTSRTKKADMVNMILELSGVATGGEASNGGAASRGGANAAPDGASEDPPSPSGARGRSETGESDRDTVACGDRRAGSWKGQSRLRR